MALAPSWTRLPGVVSVEIEAWAVGPMVDGFQGNVNVLAQEFPGRTAQDYIDYSKRGGVMDVAEIVRLDDGTKGARFVYEVPRAGTTLEALGIAAVDDGVAVLTFDLPDKKVNTLGRAVLAELGGILHSLAARTDLRGLLFRSGKPGQYIAGADLTELGALALATKEQAGEAITLGHKLFGGFAKMPFPTVALIDGNCMGGGTELSLAMDERIVRTWPS